MGAEGGAGVKPITVLPPSPQSLLGYLHRIPSTPPLPHTVSTPLSPKMVLELLCREDLGRTAYWRSAAVELTLTLYLHRAPSTVFLFRLMIHLGLVLVGDLGS